MGGIIPNNGYNPFAYLENFELKLEQNKKYDALENKKIGNFFGGKNLLYGNFNPEEYGKTKEKLRNQENIEKPEQIIKNLEIYLEDKNILELPALKGLYNNEKIDSETYLNILKNLYSNPNKKINKIIDSLEIQNPETKEELDRVFNETNPQKNKENFNKTIKEFQIDGTEKLLDVINKKSNDSIYEEVYELIATNYFEVDNLTEKPENNIKIAIETAGNKVLDKYPSIKKMSDTQTYKNAFIDIKSGNIKDGIEGIKNLLLLGSVIAYAGNKLTNKQKEKAGKIIEEKYKQRIKTIEKEIKKLNEEIKENKSKEKVNLEKIERLQKEKEEITSGALLKKAGKLERNPEKKEQKEKN